MGKVYDLDGRRKCDGCCVEYPTTRRKERGIWYVLCANCAAVVDKMREERKANGRS